MAEKKEIEFIISNSFYYVVRERRYRVSRIATLENGAWDYSTKFGRVIFCRANNDRIASLDDLKGKSFMVVNDSSFGGWIYGLEGYLYIFSSVLE